MYAEEAKEVNCASEIQEQVNTLHSNVSELSDVLENLENKIQSICAQSVPTPPSTGTEVCRSIESPLGSELSGINGRLYNLIRASRELRSRIRI